MSKVLPVAIQNVNFGHLKFQVEDLHRKEKFIKIHFIVSNLSRGYQACNPIKFEREKLKKSGNQQHDTLIRRVLKVMIS